MRGTRNEGRLLGRNRRKEAMNERGGTEIKKEGGGGAVWVVLLPACVRARGRVECCADILLYFAAPARLNTRV